MEFNPVKTNAEFTNFLRFSPLRTGTYVIIDESIPNLAIIEIITSELTALVASPVACALPPLEQINQKIKPAEDNIPELIISMYEFLFSGSLI